MFYRRWGKVTGYFRARTERWLLSLRDGFVSLLPLTMFGVVAMLLQHFPYQPYLSFLNSLFGPGWRDVLERAVAASHGVFGLALSVVVAVHLNGRLSLLSDEDDTPSPLMVGLSTLINFMVCVLYAPEKDGGFGYEAMLLGILVGIASAELLHWAARQRWLTLVTVPLDADKMLYQALRLSLPVFFCGGLFMLANGLLRQLPVTYHPLAAFAEWAELQSFGDVLATSMATLVNHVFWFIGVHGGHVLDAYGSDLFSPAEHPPGSGLAWRPLFDAFVLLGGAGSTLGLVFAIWYAVPHGSQRRIAMLGLFPSIFNINEIILFGLPVVLSPIYVLPFVMVPLALAALTLLALQVGFIQLQPAGIPWTTPPLISGWLLSGSWRGAALQAVGIVLSTLFYLPFVRLAEAERKHHQEEVYRKALALIQAETPSRDRITRRRDEVGRMARKLLDELRAGIDQGQLSLLYQPKHDRNGVLVSLEALICWHSPNHGRIPAAVAVNLAEEGGCIDRLGDWVMREACACKARWNALGHGYLSLAINVSPTQLGAADFAPRLAALLQHHGLASHEIEIEITESEAIPDEKGTNATLQALENLGVLLSMDDFGMGYSSLLHLRRFDIHAIKIDGSLTRDVLSNSTNADIIRAITSLGKARNVEIVAEFVETGPQRDALLAMGCDLFQGHFHSPPLAEADCLPYFERQGACARLAADAPALPS